MSKRTCFPFTCLVLLFCIFVTTTLHSQSSSGGIGVILEYLPEKKIHRVRAVFKESPAARAKMVAGEEILSVEGQSTQKMSFEDLGNKIKGSPGTSVSLELKNPKTGLVRTLSLVRSDAHKVSPLIVQDNTVPIHNPSSANTLTLAEKEEVKNKIKKLQNEADKKRMHQLLLDFQSGKMIKGDFLQILRKTF